MMLLSEEERGPLLDDFAKAAGRDPFSQWLPYRAYDDDADEYINLDNTFGKLWECRPLTFVGEKAFKSLTSVLRQEYPEQTVFQFILYPDDHIGPLLDRYKELKTRDDPLVQEAAARYAAHLFEGRKGLDKMRGIPVRNFRLFVSVKAPERLKPEQVAQIVEGLSSAGLSPVSVRPGRLLAWLRRIFNRHVPQNDEGYNDGRFICNQIINADDPVVGGGSDPFLTFGGRHAGCLTPKSLPDSIDPLGMNCMIGGFGGSDEDATQLKHRFIWTTSVFFRAPESAIKSKASIQNMQRASGNLAKSLGRRNVEIDWVLDDLEKMPYCNVISSMWVFGDDADDLNRGMARARGLWEKQNFVMQRETKILKEMLLSALPFGLYPGKNWQDVDLLTRDFKMSVAGAALMLPVQADFAGGMKPVLMTIGRKGQLITLDVFDKGASNYNFLVAAGSGAGKSFQTNFLVNNYYATGALMRITDIGYSYKKQCASVGGRFIDIGDEATRLCINPFLVAGHDEEDKKGDDTATAYVVLTMIYSNTGTAHLTENHFTLVKDAVAFARERDGGLMGVDHVYEFLSKYPAHAGDVNLPSAIDLAREMGFNLRDFTSRGKYGKLFNGQTTLNISSDEFVVFELEELQNNPELFRVLSLQVINSTTQDLYLNKDKSVRRFMLFDEAWKYLGKGDHSAAVSLIGKVIEEAYRRARKYGGSTGIVTQSPLDLLSFGTAGGVIRGNSAFKFFLESNTYKEAVREGILEYQGLLMDLVCSVKNNKPLYSEILYDTPFGCGVGRLCLDPYNYWTNTTDPAEVARYEAAVAAGLTPRDAILKLSGVTP